MPKASHFTFTAKRSTRDGFTMIEIILAVTVMSIAFITVFALVSAQLEAMRIIEVNAQRRTQLEGLRAAINGWVKDWESPSTTTLVGEAKQFQLLRADDMSFFTWPGPAAFSETGEGRYRITLMLRAGGELKGELGIRRTLEGEDERSDEFWLTLMNNIRALEISYWDPTGTWAKDWNNNAAFPRLIRFRVFPEEMVSSYDFVVTIPPRRIRL